jgi:acylphosphatase
VEEVVRLFMISGKVQGVYFRQSARRRAEALAIRGFAANTPHGMVQVLAHGKPAAIEEFLAWLHRGPAGARVDGVQEIMPQGAEVTVPVGFETR